MEGASSIAQSSITLGIDAAPAIRLELLRGFSVTDRGSPSELPLSAQRVVAFLALKGKAAHRDHVAGALWLDTTTERANANLRSALWRVRAACRSLVRSTGLSVSLGQQVSVDIVELSAVARRLCDPAGDWREGDLDALPSAGDLLPDWYDDWVIMERERFRQLRLHALESLCDRLVEAGRFPHAVQAGVAAVAGEPLRESAHRALIRAHLAEGNAGEAIRQYRSYRHLLREELGLDPSSLMERLVQGLRI